MKVTVNTVHQKEAFVVEGNLLHCDSIGNFVSVDIRKPKEGLADGITFILPGTQALLDLTEQLLAVYGQLSSQEQEAQEKEEAREEANRSESLKAAVHAALDDKVAEASQSWRDVLRNWPSGEEANE